MTLFDTGVRPIIDDYLAKEAEKVRDYGEYWSASSAGYCMRKNIFERLKIPYVNEDARKTRVFASGHIFHRWVQDITKNAGVSVAQELELQDEELMIRGHVDDLVLITDPDPQFDGVEGGESQFHDEPKKKLILYDYKTAHSRSFHYAKDRPISYFHKMQLGTYMYMLRNVTEIEVPLKRVEQGLSNKIFDTETLQEARRLSISKDDLRMDEKALYWSDELESEILAYWTELNKWWADKKLPPCTCADHEGGFMSNEKYNPYFYEGEPCSIKWYELNKETK